MIFRQITHDDLGCASYLIGDEKAGVAAVVDPQFEVDEYLELARYMGVAIEHVFETHNHADHVSGHGRLAAATGATIHIHRDAAPAYAHEPFDDGDEWSLVARPDLAIEKADGARGIFRSLRGKLLDLPADVEIWPGHLGGSMCGGPGMDMKISSTIGFERRHNPTLGIEEEDRFVEEALASLGPQPPNFS